MAQPQTEVGEEAPQSVAPRSLTFPTNIVGDYEHTFVDEVPAKYHCNICSKVLRDARLTVCCGQHYCDSCLEQWSASKVHNKKKTCPHCRKEGFEHVLDKSVIREINEFRVKCSNHERGCGWVGELGDLDRHIESENGCGYKIIKCDYYGYVSECFFGLAEKCYCDHLCQRQSLAEHKKTCKYRRYECEYCGEVDTYDAIAGEGKICISPDSDTFYCDSNHYSCCWQYPVECPNKCGEKAIKRCDIRCHRELCPLESLLSFQECWLFLRDTTM